MRRRCSDAVRLFAAAVGLPAADARARARRHRHFAARCGDRAHQRHRPAGQRAAPAAADQAAARGAAGLLPGRQRRPALARHQARQRLRQAPAGGRQRGARSERLSRQAARRDQRRGADARQAQARHRRTVFFSGAARIHLRPARRPLLAQQGRSRILPGRPRHRPARRASIPGAGAEPRCVFRRLAAAARDLRPAADGARALSRPRRPRRLVKRSARPHAASRRIRCARAGDPRAAGGDRRRRRGGGRSQRLRRRRWSRRSSAFRTARASPSTASSATRPSSP